MNRYLVDPDFILYVGDSREVLRDLEPASVDCVITSPPYWGLRDYGTEGQIGLEATPEEYVVEMVEVFREARRVLAPHGTLWLNLGSSYVIGRGGGLQGNGQRSDRAFTAEGMGKPVPSGYKPKDMVPIPWMVAMALQQDGWYLRADIIWSKPNPMPESVTDRPTKAHEYVFLLSKQPRYFFDQEAVREPPNLETITHRERYGGKHTNGKGVDSSRMDGDRPANGGIGHNPAGRNVRSVWEIVTQPYPDAHFATFPEALPERCIKAGCPEGGTVLDPFLGSGTTALVARRLGRKCVGIELNEEYAKLAGVRLSQLSLLAEGAA